MRISMYYPITIAPPPHTEAFTGNFVAYALDGTPPDTPPVPPPPPIGQRYTSITVPVNTTFTTNTSQVTSRVTTVAGTQTQAQTTTQRVTSAQTTDWNRQTLQTVMPDGEYVYRNTFDINNPSQRNTQWTTDVIQNTTITTGGVERNTDVTTAWQTTGTRQTNRNTYKLTAAQSLPVSVPISVPVSKPVSVPVSVPVSKPVSVPVSVPVSKPVSKPVSVPVSVPVSKPPSQRNTSAMTKHVVQTSWPTEYPAAQRLTEATYNDWPGVTNGVWRTTDTYGGPAQTLVGVLQNTTATTTVMRDTQAYNTWPEGISTVIWQTAVSANTTVSTTVDGPAPTVVTVQRVTTIPNGYLNTVVSKTVERLTTWPTSAV